MDEGKRDELIKETIGIINNDSSKLEEIKKKESLKKKAENLAENLLKESEKINNEEEKNKILEKVNSLITNPEEEILLIKNQEKKKEEEELKKIEISLLEKAENEKNLSKKKKILERVKNLEKKPEEIMGKIKDKIWEEEFFEMVPEECRDKVKVAMEIGGLNKNVMLARKNYKNLQNENYQNLNRDSEQQNFDQGDLNSDGNFENDFYQENGDNQNQVEHFNRKDILKEIRFFLNDKHMNDYLTTFFIDWLSVQIKDHLEQGVNENENYDKENKETEGKLGNPNLEEDGENLENGQENLGNDKGNLENGEENLKNGNLGNDEETEENKNKEETIKKKIKKKNLKKKNKKAKKNNGKKLKKKIKKKGDNNIKKKNIEKTDSLNDEEDSINLNSIKTLSKVKNENDSSLNGNPIQNLVKLISKKLNLN